MHITATARPREPGIEPDRVADDFWQEAVALKRYRSHPMMLIGDQPLSYPSYRDIARSILSFHSGSLARNTAVHAETAVPRNPENETRAFSEPTFADRFVSGGPAPVALHDEAAEKACEFALSKARASDDAMGRSSEPPPKVSVARAAFASRTSVGGYNRVPPNLERLHHHT
jgi:hypothetical protein